MITDGTGINDGTGIAGVQVGHWTDPVARTGCTVVLFPEGTVASGEVRGGAPATREFALLAPEMLVDRVDAVLLTGGSAFGLAAADGVMAWCEERGRGFPTGAGPVPIVVGLGLFDLLVGDPRIRPGPAEGRAACEAATDGTVDLCAVGAGTGATLGAVQGRGMALPGGLGAATAEAGGVVVTALVAANAFGLVDDGLGAAAGASALAGRRGRAFGTNGPVGANTTIGVITTNATLRKLECLLVAQGGHDGLARALVPAHTRFDGDALVAASVGEVEADVDLVRALAVAAVERAVRSATPTG
ncbi:P1 family peptidase [soil metagenome]